MLERLSILREGSVFLRNQPSGRILGCLSNARSVFNYRQIFSYVNRICVFLDGSTCDEWAYYRGGCGPAAQKAQHLS